MKSNSILYRSLLISLLLSVSVFFEISAQGRLILNGGIVSIAQSAYLVIDNPAANAITRNSGHIISEGEDNRIKWNIGTTTGTYSIPWGYGSVDCIPLTFTKTAGTGSGHFVFSTYHTNWNNIALLPTGVTNINGASGTDNSAYASDRFWQINALGYSTKPSLSNLTFTYLDAEHAGPNTITEANLKVKRYNSSLNSWIDNILASTLNTTTNILTVTSVDDSNLEKWWMLGTLNANRYWVAPSNSSSTLSANWSETSGGAGEAGVPVLGDAIIFDESSNFTCVLDSDLSGSALIVNPGFLGTITQGENAISISNDATFSGGTFIGGTGNLLVGGDFVVSGSSFIAPSSSLDIKSDFTITSGSFSHNNGTAVFSGASGATQNISSTTAQTFNNISVTNTSASPGVSVQSHQNLKGVLSLASNVNFDADGSSNTAIFKLLSTADYPTQDAAIAALPSGAQVSGKVTVQRFMTKEGASNERIYRYISSPIQNATVADLQQEIPVTGTFTGKSSCSGCASSSQSLFAYNEAVITDTDRNGVLNQHDGYIDFPDVSNTETFQTGRGYALYVRADILSTTLWDLRGVINSGNVTPVSFPVTYTSSGTLSSDGWNLVGNPFPSTIDWNAPDGWTKTNLETSIYITDNGSAASIQTATWNGVTGTNGGSQYIATGQGFWIKANGNGQPTLQATENIKAAATQTEFFRQAPLSNLLRVTVSKGTLRDETVIHFREDATTDFDGHADARKLPNSIMNLSSIINDGRKLAINSMPAFDCNTIIPLAIENVTTGNYTLKFSEYESFPQAITILLTDNFLDKVYDIQNGSYNFSVTSALASYGSERFKISFSTPELNPLLTISASDICEGENATIKIENIQSEVTYSALFSTSVISAEEQDGIAFISLSQHVLHLGENRVMVRSAVELCNSFVEREVVFNVKPLSTPLIESAVNCGKGSVTLKANAPEAASYNWYEEETSDSGIDGQHAESFQTPILKKSKTYFVSVVNALGCEGKRIPVEATIVNPEQAVISAGINILTSNYQEGNQWYFNEEKIDGATEQTLIPSESGTYKTEVNTQGCMTSAEIEYVIPVVQIITSNPAVPHKEELLPTSPDVEPISFYNIISISPNPFRGNARIEISDTFKNVTNIRIMNSVGQVIGFVELTQDNGKKTGTIQLSDYPSGIYLVQIFSTTGVHERKIIKQ